MRSSIFFRQLFRLSSDPPRPPPPGGPPPPPPPGGPPPPPPPPPEPAFCRSSAPRAARSASRRLRSDSCSLMRRSSSASLD
ncbi:MAG: hypothetical protein DWH94_10830 [Planctomycetota bacterium]|nr:MAG: hypothetical protein DWH94_10830 [Planctomycetota bacterium]